MTLAVELAVEAGGWATISDLEGLVSRAIEAARGVAGIRLADGAEVSVLLADDATIRELNRDWRGLDKATNVLSFPSTMPQPLQERPLLGDLAIAWETTAREAAEEDKPVAAHLSHLVVHGFLHLVGYDHETTPDAEAMEAMEIRVLAALGIADPYAGSDLLEKQVR